MLVEDIAILPKVVLHEHLDGCVLPETLADLLERAGSAFDPTSVTAPQGATLERYLECFTQPLSVMQDASSLERIARELSHQWCQDGVVYGEVRFAPELHTRTGLSMPEAVEAVLAGLEQGPVPARLVLTAMRNKDRSHQVATVAASFASFGVVGFDLAGPEAGYPLSLHSDAINAARAAGLGITLHAGEAVGPGAVREALDLGAHRIGHGVTSILDPGLLDALANSTTMLEVCVTSNLQTGAAASLLGHQVKQLRDSGVTVSLQVDNRTVSGVTLSQEMHTVCQAFGWGSADLLEMLDTSIAAAFLPYSEKQDLRLRLARDVR
jgi:adenosine deaminase